MGNGGGWREGELIATASVDCVNDGEGDSVAGVGLAFDKVDVFKLAALEAALTESGVSDMMLVVESDAGVPGAA